MADAERVRVALAAAAALLAVVVASLAAAAPAPPAPRGSILVSSTRTTLLHDEIWLVDLRSGRRLNISRNPAADRDPVLSPDGRTLAFVSDRGAREALWTMRPDGGGLRRIAGPFAERPNEHVQVRQPSWSPDGRRLVFLTQRPTRGEARIVGRDGGASTRVATGVFVESVFWSPDSRRLATTSVDAKGAWATVYDLRGRRIWRQRGGVAGWSARGELAIVVGNRRAIVVVGPDGRIRRRTSGLGALWSPAGLLLAVGDVGSVRVLDERGRIRLRSTALQLGFGSAWSPDGSALLVFDRQYRPFRLNLSGKASRISRTPADAVWTPESRLAVLDPRGIAVRGRAPVRLLPAGVGGLCAAGQPLGLRWLDRNRLLYAAGHGGQNAGDLWVVTGRQVRRLAGAAGGWRGAPAWSPDGSSVVYEHGSAFRHGGGCSGPYAPHLRIADASGGGVRVLTQSPEGHDLDPRWSPDGTQVAFARGAIDDPVTVGILVVDVRTRTERRLTSGDDTLPTWTADGLGVVYQHGGEIRRVAVADGKVTSVVASGALPEAAPTGSLVAFLRGGTLWTIRVDGSDARRLGSVQRQPRSPLAYATTEAPRWSPDGRRIAVADARGVLVFDLGGGDGRLVAAPGAGGVAWSADGRTLSFHAPVGKYSRGIFNSGYVQRTELYTVPAGGGTPTRLTNDLANVLGASAWRP